MPRTLAALLAATALAAPRSAAGADAIVIVSATGAGVAPAEIATVVETLRVDLERTGRFVALPVRSPAPAGEEPSVAQAAAAARAAGASLALVLRVTRLGAETWVRVAAFRPDGSIASVGSASAPAGAPLDAAVATAAASVPASSPPVAPPPARPAPASVPPPWTPPPTRAMPAMPRAPAPAPPAAPPPLAQEPRTDAMGFRAGAIFPRQRGTGDARAPVFAGFGLARWDDAGPITFEWFVDWYLSDLDHPSRRDRYLATGVGALLPFGRGPVAPYVGVELPYTWATFGGDGADGWALRVPFGVLFDRFGPAPLRVEATWFVNGGRERDLVTGALYTQYGFTLSLVVAGAATR